MNTVFDEFRYLIPFRTRLLPQIFTDVLVIGAGVAGLRAAIEAAGTRNVICLAKGSFEASNTFWAQGGIAAAVSGGDSPQEHLQNTLEAGAGLCDEPVVRTIVEAAPQAMRELEDWRMPFDRSSDGRILLGMEGGHTASRILHAEGDATGRHLTLTLLKVAKQTAKLRMFERCFVIDLLSESDEAGSPVLGALTFHTKYGLQVIWARATILASGGCGRVYRESTNPPVSTGDGHAMAYRAGAALADMEFIQFHPTTLYVAGASRALISEAVRGEGAILVDHDERRFMAGQHPLADLAPRDIVSRAILRHQAEIHDDRIYLDARHFEPGRFAERFPGIHKLLAKFDINPSVDLIPIRPSAHYMIGGLWVDAEGRTNLPGLYACGEASCTGLHGANRLASNSLLEGLVCGRIVGQVASRSLTNGAPSPREVVSDKAISERSELDLPDVLNSLRAVMWRGVGIERSGTRMEEIAEMIDFWARYTLDKIFEDPAGWEVQNLLTVGALMTRAADWRKESRGTHFRLDYPKPDESLRMHAIWRRGSEEPFTRAVKD